MTLVEILAGAIADGYWTLCSPEEAVEAFRADVVGDSVEVDGVDVAFTPEVLDAAAALFTARSVE